MEEITSIFSAISAPLSKAPSVRLQFNSVTQMHHSYLHLSVIKSTSECCLSAKRGWRVNVGVRQLILLTTKLLQGIRATAEAARGDNDFWRSVSG